MKAIKTVIFLIICAALAALAYVATDRSGAGQEQESRLLSKDQSQKLSDVRIIMISSATGETVSPSMDDKGVWRLPEKADYPADPAKIRDFLLTLSASRLIEKKTANPDRFAALGLEAGVDVVLLDASGSELKSVTFGKNIDERDAVYVKPKDAENAYLASGNFNVTAEPMDWARTKPVAIPSGLVESVESVSASGSLTVARERKDGAETWKLEGSTATKNQSELQNMAAALEAFLIEDVKPASELSAYWDGEAATTLMFSLKDGALIMVTLAKDADGNAWARFDVASAPVPSQVSGAAKEAAQEEKEAPAALPGDKNNASASPEEFVVDYDLLQELVKGRAFLIPDFVYDDATGL